VNAAGHRRAEATLTRASLRARRALVVLAALLVAGLAVDVVRPRASAASAVRETRIDINVADEAQLCLLPEVGPAVARRIIESRNTQGPFAQLSDLRRVKGIGPATLAAVEPHAVCSVSAP